MAEMMANILRPHHFLQELRQEVNRLRAITVAQQEQIQYLVCLLETQCQSLPYDNYSLSTNCQQLAENGSYALLNNCSNFVSNVNACESSNESATEPCLMSFEDSQMLEVLNRALADDDDDQDWIQIFGDETRGKRPLISSYNGDGRICRNIEEEKWALREELQWAEKCVNGVEKGWTLPERGKLLESVMEAGPLLQNLMIVGPLPEWKCAPPITTYQPLPNFGLGAKL